MDHLALFMESRVAQGVSPNTLNWYRQHLGYFTKWLTQEDISMLDLTPLQFNGFIASQRSRYSPATTTQSFGAVRAFYRWMVEMELCPTDPTRKLKRPKVPDTLPRVVAREYITHLIDSICPVNWVDHRDRCILELMFCTGLRVSEVRKLMLTDVSIDRRSLHIHGKGAKDRLVFYPEDLKASLWRWMHVHRPPTTLDAVFLSSYPNLKVRSSLAQNSIYNMLVHRVSVAAMEWRSPHAFRHGHAVDMLIHGLSTKEVQYLLGHAEVRTTEKYLRLAPALIQGRFDTIWDSYPLR
jgi:integrase/recombinase XerD